MATISNMRLSFTYLQVGIESLSSDFFKYYLQNFWNC